MRLLWEDYCLWQTRDKKLLKRINSLIKDIQRNTYEGIGKPEPLKGDLSGWWSRRIDDTHRIVYREQDGKWRIMMKFINNEKILEKYKKRYYNAQ